MFTNPFNHIKNTFRSSLFTLTHRSEESITVSVITDNRTRGTAIIDSSAVLFRKQAHSLISTSQSSQPPGELATEFDASSSSSFDRSEHASPSLGISNSTENIYTALLSPNARLFRGSQDEFGFDVYIPHEGSHCGPADLFECSTVLPWQELVAALASETGRQPKDVVLSSKFYSGIVDGKDSYQAWLAWSRKTDGPCSTDLWLA